MGEAVEGAEKRLSFLTPRGRKAKVTTRSRAWPDTEILAGIGSGHSPPTAALEDKQAAANAAPDGGKTGRRARRHACRKI